MSVGRSACLALAAALACGAAPRVVAEAVAAGVAPATVTLRARIVATGLPGAHGIRQVGRFHSGGPLATNPEFLLQTQPRRVLDPERVLVAHENNLGAAIGNRAHAAGSVLSIDPRWATTGRPIAVPANLAVLPQRGEGGPLQIYTAQTEAQMNGSHNGGARTAGFTAASGPRYLSDQQSLRAAVDCERAVRAARLLAQVHGASYSVSEGASNAATLVKLSKVVILVPLLLVFGLFQSRDKRSRVEPGAATARIPIPWFVFGFAAVLLFNSAVTLQPQVRRLMLEFDQFQFQFLMVMVALGLTTPVARLREAGGAWRLIGIGMVALAVSAASAYGLVALAGLTPNIGAAAERAENGR